MWLYKRPFAITNHEAVVRFDARTTGLFSELWIDGHLCAGDHTPASGPEAIRNHRLATTLADGRCVEVEAGYNSMINVGIAVRVDSALVHESHPGRPIAYPERVAAMILKQNAKADPAFDLSKLKRNRVPIIVDILIGLLFFVIAKLTDLTTAALVGAGVGLALVVAQRFVKVDLIGGLALFGVVMLLISAGFALAFQDDEMIKQRSTIVGLIGASCFLFDGRVLKGRWLGRGISRYLAYSDIDERRLAIGLGLTGLAMAAANFLVVGVASTDVWLFYTTFGDVALSIPLVLLAVRWARRLPRSAAPP